jgi:isochorismate synthase / 2-succinyl-5-enolpyruvyl-6-hydroxy-3-cyclohexene-1-carboxylate synthase / 2-succinyl-6-hydroxy-2,4-cyclohexadiene-1-carboxylate synthase / o-succinylbenzoate synthase
MQEKVVLLLHGFLGTSEDWVPMMKALSPSARVIAVDLPGHGESQMMQHHIGNSKQVPFTVQADADLLLKLMCHITDGGVVVVGYLMGARIALHMALNQIHKVALFIFIFYVHFFCLMILTRLVKTDYWSSYNIRKSWIER